MRFARQRRLIDGYTDSDWGGCTQSRKATSGAVIMVGKHLIKSFSKQQKILALSSAEAETYGKENNLGTDLSEIALAIARQPKVRGV